MGGGNAQKSATARARNAEANAKPKGSQLKANQAAMSIKCMVCLQVFISTSTEAKLREHWESKHSKLPVEQCFPQLKPAA